MIAKNLKEYSKIYDCLSKQLSAIAYFIGRSQFYPVSIPELDSGNML